MKGYKGFEPGLICKGKQYAENSVFEESKAEVCKSGMHFCENPFDVLDYYGFVNDKAEINDFAEVEALDEAKTDDGKKYSTKKLKVGAKIGIAGLVKAFIEFTLSKVDSSVEPAATNTGYRSAATNTGDMSAATNTGDRSAATNTGDMSAAKVEGKESIAIVTGYGSKVCGVNGSWIVATERDDEGHILCVRAAAVDDDAIKSGVWYTLKDGEFVEAIDND